MVIDIMNWENNVRKVVPYVAGEQPQNNNVIKLNTNECPYPPAPEVQSVLHGFDSCLLRKYPDPDVSELVAALAKRHGLSKEQVFVGVGSDDVLAMSFLTFFNSDKPILFPDITYSFYDVWADLYKIPYECQPLDENFRIRKEDYQKQNGGIVIANPNAPTGVWEAPSFFEEIVKANPDSVVIVDEAYVDFGGESAVALLPKYENLLVVQTLSKSRSLAGARVGIALGQPAVIADLNTIKFSFNPYNVNRVSQALAAAAVRDKAYFAKCCQNIMADRQLVTEGLEAQGFQVLPSLANFVLARHQLLDGQQLYQKLKQRDILVRWFDEPRIRDFVRISIGTREDMQQLLAAVAEILQEVR